MTRLLITHSLFLKLKLLEKLLLSLNESSVEIIRHSDHQTLTCYVKLDVNILFCQDKCLKNVKIKVVRKTLLQMSAEERNTDTFLSKVQCQ